MVVLIAGNRDYLEPSSPYLTYQWNENVITIFSEQLERIRLPELKLEIIRDELSSQGDFGAGYGRRVRKKG